MDTSNVTWEQAIVQKLDSLHERIVKDQLRQEELGLAYEEWGHVYDRILPTV